MKNCRYARLAKSGITVCGECLRWQETHQDAPAPCMSYLLIGLFVTECDTVTHTSRDGRYCISSSKKYLEILTGGPELSF